MSELTKSLEQSWDSLAQGFRERFAAENEAFDAVLGCGGFDRETSVAA